MKKLIKSFWFLVIIAALFVLYAGKPQYEIERDDLAKSVKAVADPKRLQVWAETVLAKVEEYQTISDDDIPKELLRTGRGKPYAYVATDSERDKKFVMFSWGNGFGHQGIIIGDENYRRSLDHKNLSLSEWIPGIYFFGQKQ